MEYIADFTRWQLCTLPPHLSVLPHPQQVELRQLNILLHPFQAEVKCTLCLWPPFCQGWVQSAHQVCWTMWFPWAQVCIIFTCRGCRFTPVELDQLWQGTDRKESKVLSAWYAVSRTSQILAQFVLQFSASRFYFFQWRKRKREDKTNKQTNNGFFVGKPAAVLVPAHAETYLTLMCNKKLF
jgi:hypothetical protein